MKAWEKLALIFVVAVGGNWIGGWLFAEALPRLVGTFTPVVTQATLYEPREAPPPSYRYVWKADAVKSQDACVFSRVEWFLGQRGENSIQVESVFLDRPQTRKAGELHWDELAISLAPDEVLNNSHGDVLHRCPWIPFLVRSPFFTSGSVQVKNASKE
jgi:hypothetical protein